MFLQNLPYSASDRLAMFIMFSVIDLNCELTQYLWTWSQDITHHPAAMLYWVPFPNSLTTIHTWAHLAIATNMRAGWVNDRQVGLMTLKLRAHTCP